MPSPTAYDVAVRSPAVHPPDATAEEVRAFLAGEHVHLALVTDGETLLTTIEPADLADLGDAAATTPARDLGTLAGRTVPPDLPVDRLEERFAGTGLRRLVVVADDGRLLGLVCRKRSGEGWCSDAGIAERRATR